MSRHGGSDYNTGAVALEHTQPRVGCENDKSVVRISADMKHKQKLPQPECLKEAHRDY